MVLLDLGNVANSDVRLLDNKLLDSAIGREITSLLCATFMHNLHLDTTTSSHETGLTKIILGVQFLTITECILPFQTIYIIEFRQTKS